MSTQSNVSIKSPAKTKRLNARMLIILAMFSAIAYLLVFIFRIPVVMFLSYEPKDVIITIGSFLFGPMSAVLTSLVVSFIEMVTISTTGPIGLIMNVIATTGFACTAGIIYKKKKSMSGAVIGLICGMVVMTILMISWNYLITPLYMGTPREAVVEMLIPVFLPFNLIKGGLNTAITLLLYKPISNALKRTGLLPPSTTAEPQEKRKISMGLMLSAGLVLITLITWMLVLNGTI